ncbi:ribosomal RNA-processing protein 8 isoform X2 [Carettochelys insculpta]|uniref:ribosomal RNA-processing protein 8 isoform X2 n=1 Tax=Carettochelys insculpta TaxID=44489 RepID=UPI003EBBD3EB
METGSTRFRRERGGMDGQAAGSQAMFEEVEWKDTDDGALLPPPHCSAQHNPLAPASCLQKQHGRLLSTLQRLEASSCMTGCRPLSAESEMDSGFIDQAGRKQRQGPKRRAASSPYIAPGAPSSSDTSQAGLGLDTAGRRQRRETLKERAHTPNKEQLSKELGAGAAGGPAPLLSRKQWRNKQKNKRRQKNKFKVGAGQGQSTAALPLSELSGLLRARMEEQLQAARFRHINQQLYTSTSQEAAQLFQHDPEAFAIYHRGFAQQVGRWPENPVHRIIRYLQGRPASLVVADFGCGDCKIATSVKNKVHSFDLVALSPHVTVCDMAKVPLAAESVDVAVFCLALMGTNLQEILEEANRVLKPGGILKVAEVSSRFTDIQAFINAMTQLGFRIVSKELDNPFFWLLDFRKRGRPRPRARGALPGLALRPCRYKPR